MDKDNFTNLLDYACSSIGQTFTQFENKFPTFLMLAIKRKTDKIRYDNSMF